MTLILESRLQKNKNLRMKLRYAKVLVTYEILQDLIETVQNIERRILTRKPSLPNKVTLLDPQ